MLGRLPAFALGVWFGSLLKKDIRPSYRLYIGLAVCPLLRVEEVPRLAVLLVLAAVLFWTVYALSLIHISTTFSRSFSAGSI